MFNHSRKLGVHLTDNHIRLVEFSGNKIISCATFDLPNSLTEIKKNKMIASLGESFATTLKSLKPAAKTKDTVLTIGDEEIFIKIMTMPKMPIAEAKRAAPHELEPDLPLKAENMYVDLNVLGEVVSKDKQKTSNSMEVIVFAANKNYIDALTDAIESAGLNLQAIEISSVSLGRLYAKDHNTYLTVDLGSSHGAITIFENDLIHVTTSVSFRHPAWSDATKGKQAEITEEQATKDYAPVISDVAEKIQTAIRYYHNRVDTPKKIEKIFLSGSGARVPHIDKIISDQINLTVTIGHAPITVSAPCTTSHLAAIGASLRNTTDEN